MISSLFFIDNIMKRIIADKDSRKKITLKGENDTNKIFIQINEIPQIAIAETAKK